MLSQRSEYEIQCGETVGRYCLQAGLCHNEATMKFSVGKCRQLPFTGIMSQRSDYEIQCGETVGRCSLSPFLIGRMFLCEPNWKYSSKLYSGFKKLRSACSGNIRPIRRSLPLIG